MKQENQENNVYNLPNAIAGLNLDGEVGAADTLQINLTEKEPETASHTPEKKPTTITSGQEQKKHQAEEWERLKRSGGGMGINDMDSNYAFKSNFKESLMYLAFIGTLNE